jgi:hypothetical protein
MYTQILEAALRVRRPPGTEMTTGEALIALIECRHHLDSSATSERREDWNSKALANQVAYDLALIDVARSVGLDCDCGSFDQPQRRRIELERELITRGIRLDELDQRANSS